MYIFLDFVTNGSSPSFYFYTTVIVYLRVWGSHEFVIMVIVFFVRFVHNGFRVIVFVLTDRSFWNL